MPSWLNKKTTAIIGVVAFIPAAWALSPYIRPAPVYTAVDIPKSVYFYDMSTGELFAAPAEQKSLPIINPATPGAQPSGVYAHVYSCQSCDDVPSRFIAYLEKPNPNAFSASPTLVASLPSKASPVKWDPESQDSSIYEQQAQTKCKSGELKQCQPPG